MSTARELYYAFDRQTFHPYRSDSLQIKVASAAWEKHSYFKLRQRVFSTEQQLLLSNEKDPEDFRAIPIVALAMSCAVPDEVVGAVRIYQTASKEHGDSENTWFGGRLCVEERYRSFRSIGKLLINEAVARAKDLGCTEFLANVQDQNEAYFAHLHWHRVEDLELAGRPHVRMRADLHAYPFMPRSGL